MTNKSITVTYEKEKLDALEIYLKEKGLSIEEELLRAVEALYVRNVPPGVRKYLDLKSGGEEGAPNER